MGFSRISWAGIKTGDFQRTVGFFEEVGLRMVRHDPETEEAAFQLDNGDFLEVFGPRHPGGVEGTQPISLGFEVENLEATRKEMESRGVEFVTEVERWQNHSWCYFKGPEGLVYEIKQSGTGR